MKENFTYGLKWRRLARGHGSGNLSDFDPTRTTCEERDPRAKLWFDRQVPHSGALDKSMSPVSGFFQYLKRVACL